MGVVYDNPTGGVVYDDKPVTASDRAQALTSGLKQGAAYLSTFIPDTNANVWNVSKALLGSPWALTGHKVPSALEVDQGANPFGSWLTHQMDKSPITTTQMARPDDAVSRWLHVGGSVVPSALAAGGGTVSGTARALAGGLGGASAAQGVHELHPFSNYAAETASEFGANALGSVLGGGLIPGRPTSTPQNEAVMEGQGAGYKFPAATTNPTPVNKLIARVAGGATVQDKAQENNQHLTTEAGREDANLPGEGPIRPNELPELRTKENLSYNAARQIGSVTRDQPMVSALLNAKSRFTGASKMSATLAGTKVTDVIDDLIDGGPGTQFDSGHAVDTVGLLRDHAYSASRAGSTADAGAYRAAADAVEGAMERGASPQAAPIVQAWRDSRRRLAVGHLLEDATDANGNVDAVKLGKMYADGDSRFQYAPNLAVAARSANAAPKAFRVPESGPTGGHGGFWGPLTGALVGGEAAGHIGELVGGLVGHPEAGAAAGIAPVASYGAYVASRAAARKAALADALARQREAAPVAPGLAASSLGYLSRQAQ